MCLGLGAAINAGQVALFLVPVAAFLPSVVFGVVAVRGNSRGWPWARVERVTLLAIMSFAGVLYGFMSIGGVVPWFWNVPITVNIAGNEVVIN